MDIELRPALEFDLVTLADTFNRSFEGYFFPFEESPEVFAARLRVDSLDLALSRVAVEGTRPVGILLVAVRGWGCRIAGMGVALEARRRGIGRRLMDEAIEICRSSGLRHMVLEVIEQNEPAVALYQSLGFQRRRRLVGYSLGADGASAIPERPPEEVLLEVDPQRVVGQLARGGETDLPWQLSPQTFGVQGSHWKAVELEGKAFALIEETGADALTLHALVVPADSRRRGWGRRMIHALAHAYPQRALQIPARVPEDLAAPFLGTLGFKRSELTQLEMDLPL